MLHHHTEMAYFHFYESLFKPYESLIQLELCDSDVQDQIIASIQQFVDGSSSEIRSGWRPLFGALRSIKFSQLEAAEAGSHIAAILDVFEAFLATDSPIVFAHAALDCIMCLLKHIKNTKEVKASKQEVEEVVDISEIVVQQGTPELSEAALGYIVRCHSVLAKMFLMSSSPVFRGAENIHTGSHPIHVSSVVPGKEVISFDPTTVTLTEVAHSLDPLTISPSTSGPPGLLENSGLLKIWFLLIDGIVSALSSGQLENQSATLDTFFTILESLRSPPYTEFGLYCVNHLLLPGIQTWLRTASTRWRGWTKAAQGIKQTLGMTTEVVVDWVLRPEVRDQAGLASELMLKQLIIILVECCLVNSETIARLGCSCLRHLVTVGSTRFSPCQWDLVVWGLVRATTMSLYPAHQLMASFMVGSENFTGDIGSVRVAARRDCTLVETNRIRQLCYQILLMDTQLEEEELPRLSANPDQEDRSYLFLLQPLDTGETKERREDTVTVRVTLGELVTGLTAHQILLQTIGGMLLDQTSHLTPALSALLTSSQTTETVLASLSPAQLSALMSVLRQSHQTATSLDNRPGVYICHSHNILCVQCPRLSASKTSS